MKCGREPEGKNLKGRVIGIDFAPQMTDRAKQAFAESGLQDRNIELRVADTLSGESVIR